MKNIITNLIISIIPLLIINGCGTPKSLNNKKLINTYKIYENNQEINNSAIDYLILSKPNKKIFSIPIGLNAFNLSKKINDSSFNFWLNKKQNRKKRIEKIISNKQLNQIEKYSHKINNWLKKNSENPAYYNKTSINQSIKGIVKYYQNIGYFDVKVQFNDKIIDKNKVDLIYKIQTGKRYFFDISKIKCT